MTIAKASSNEAMDPPTGRHVATVALSALLSDKLNKYSIQNKTREKQRHRVVMKQKKDIEKT